MSTFMHITHTLKSQNIYSLWNKPVQLQRWNAIDLARRIFYLFQIRSCLTPRRFFSCVHIIPTVSTLSVACPLDYFCICTVLHLNIIVVVVRCATASFSSFNTSDNFSCCICVSTFQFRIRNVTAYNRRMCCAFHKTQHQHGARCGQEYSVWITSSYKLFTIKANIKKNCADGDNLIIQMYLFTELVVAIRGKPKKPTDYRYGNAIKWK